MGFERPTVRWRALAIEVQCPCGDVPVITHPTAPVVCGCGRSFRLLSDRVTKKYGGLYEDRDWLADQRAQGRSVGDVAAECGASSTTIQVWLARHGLPTRLARARGGRRRGVPAAEAVSRPLQRRCA